MDAVRLAEAAFALNDFSEAERQALVAIQTCPENVSARLLLGAVYARTQRFEQAVSELETAHSLGSQSIQGLKWLAESLRRCRRYDQAIDRATEALTQGPDAEVFYCRARCLIAVGRYEEAVGDLRQTIPVSRTPSALHFLGVSLSALDRHLEAISYFEEASRMEPFIPNHLVALGSAYLVLGKAEEAMKCGKRALKLRPEDSSAKMLLAQVLSLEGQTPESETYLRDVLEKTPDSAEANGLFGMFLQGMGRFEEAETFLERSLTLNPKQGLPLACLAQQRKVSADDLGLVESMVERANAREVATIDKIALRYALGKAYHDIGNLEQAFANYDEAHRLSDVTFQRSREYDAAKEDSRLAECISVFNKENLDRWKRLGSASARPIFIVGMIRSGTTLVEQLLSAHPDVEGAGELKFWGENAFRMWDATKCEIDAEKSAVVSSEFLNLLDRYSSTSRFVTDKMPPNHWLLGFIHSSLPNARIIHMQRDSLDVALSIWMTYLRKPPPFGDSKRNIMKACRLHERLSKHWLAVLPSDRYLQVRYEDLTSHPESVMGKVLELCDLTWDDACVHPERNERYVATPSLFRVRKPIDTKSVSKRERYAAYLGEFAELVANPF